jgi:hypothetical protein
MDLNTGTNEDFRTNRRSGAYEEGPVAETIEKRTAKLPSDLFLWAGLASIATSMVFLFAGKKQVANFIGQWVPTVLLFGVYNKIVKVGGHGGMSGGTSGGLSGGGLSSGLSR